MTKMQARDSECKRCAFLEIGQNLERQGNAHGVQDGKEINQFLRDRSADRREITESRRYHTYYAERHAANGALQCDMPHPAANMHQFIHFSQRSLHYDRVSRFRSDIAAQTEGHTNGR